MASAIFKEPFNYSSRTTNAGWAIKPGKKPQSFPKECIDAAVSAGVAERVPAKTPKPATNRAKAQSTQNEE